MASTLEFVNYVCEQIAAAGAITHRRLFEDYGIYCNGKIIGLVCDNQFFVKRTVQGAQLLGATAVANLQRDSQPYLVIESLTNTALLTDFVRITCDELPAPRHKSRLNA